MRNIELLNTQELSQRAVSFPTRDSWIDVWQAIDRLPVPLTRALLHEWAAEISAAESARLHGLSARMCLRLRKWALAELRAALR